MGHPERDRRSVSFIDTIDSGVDSVSCGLNLPGLTVAPTEVCHLTVPSTQTLQEVLQRTAQILDVLGIEMGGSGWE